MKSAILVLGGAAAALVAACTSLEGLTDVPAAFDGGVEASTMDDGGGEDAPGDADSSEPVEAESGPMSTDGATPDGGTVELTVVKSGMGTGTVLGGLGTIDCGATCSAAYAAGTTVSLQPMPSAGSVFGGWTGGGCSGTGDCSLTLTASTTVTARFDLPPPLLYVDVLAIGAGQSTVAISSSPAGISCSVASGGCKSSANFPLNSTVTLTVSGVGTPSVSAWSGATCTGNTCTVKTSADMNLTYWVTGNNIVFATAANTGNLGGLAGATALCASAATSGGLPGHYVPWLATTTVNATTALGSARGWIRPDGLPFADTLGTKGGTTGLINGQIFYAPALDEMGNRAVELVWTGSNPDGSAYDSNGTCADWTSGSATDTGDQGATQDGITTCLSIEGLNPCSGAGGVYCFGTDLATPVTFSPQSGRVAFTSKGTLTGGAGLAAADALCQSEAGAASLPNAAKFVALLATTSATAASRLSASGANWVRPDGLPLAASAASFLAQQSNLTASLHADGTYVAPGVATWAGAAGIAATGTSTSTCNGWTSSSSSLAAPTGAPQEDDAYWFGYGAGNCGESLPVYCFEQ